MRKPKSHPVKREPDLFDTVPEANDGEQIFKHSLQQFGGQMVIKVTPNAKKPRLVMPEDATLDLHIYTNAPPHEGAANQAVIVALSNWLDIPKSRLTITRGQGARIKTITIKAPA